MKRIGFSSRVDRDCILLGAVVWEVAISPPLRMPSPSAAVLLHRQVPRRKPGGSYIEESSNSQNDDVLLLAVRTNNFCTLRQKRTRGKGKVQSFESRHRNMLGSASISQIINISCPPGLFVKRTQNRSSKWCTKCKNFGLSFTMV